MKYPPFRITSIYLSLAIAWIFLSDRLAAWFFPTLTNYQHVQTIKGAVYVLTTAILLFFLLRADWETQKKYEINLQREKEKLEKALQDLSVLYNETKLLAGKLAELEEQERTHLAGELHDKVGQNLTALNIHLNILRMKLPPEISPELLQRINDMQHLVDETMVLIRDVMTDLHSPVLDEYGLPAALRELAEQFQNRTGMQCVFSYQSLPKRLPRHIENAFFRITQAALDNIIRHAEATTVNISLGIKDEIELVIADNGKGFNVDASKRKLSQPSYGFGIMRERALAVGATLEVFSKPGEGTQVVARIPKEVLDGGPSSIGR